MRNTNEIRSGERAIFETRPRFLMYLKSALIKFIIIILIIYLFSTIISLTALAQNFIINYVQIPLVQSVTVFLLLLILILILWIIWNLLSWKYTLYTLTNTRVISKKGIIRKNKSFIHYDKIQDIKVTQSLTERLFASGDIEIFSGHDYSTMLLYDIPNPTKIENLLNRAIEGDFEFQKTSRKRENKDEIVGNYERKFKR
ncbi:PH domain-containing protein [Methanobacterium sp. ACI-7]|uniref:PH domain-containing protein n=1 Tax=unclassified Methanobacterium TaxID=2627676 RepID=UPI0039C44A9A